MWTPIVVNVQGACRQHVVGGHRCCRLHGIRGSFVTALTLEPPAPTKDSTVGTAANMPEDSEGLMDQSNKICNRSK
ncbi:hypothetical protein Taro_024464 [Colocasia esculenta]|uniref:Uncharacterized protein n=1 Tax=Colocasia esculenta TaxID=4460 RepID=A0A843V6V9_COLES|nr:hypothetical protein [Colocasia esculenta]